MAPPLLPTPWQHGGVPAWVCFTSFCAKRSGGWGLLGSLALLVSLGEAAEAAPPAEVVYLNLSDGNLGLTQATHDDATANQAAVGGAMPYPPFVFSDADPEMPAPVSRADVQAYLLARLHRAFLPYNILWTAERPQAGPYSMVVVGGGPGVFGFDRRVAGVAVMDCGNRMPANVVFAFPEALGGNLHGLFATIAQETGHAFGLEHTGDEEDLMHPRLRPTQLRFTDRASPVEAPRLCGPALQNSHQALLAAVGAWPSGMPKPLADGTIPDVTPPRVRILAPAADGVVRSPVRMEAAVEDEGGLAVVVFQALGVVERRAAGSLVSHAFDLPGGPARLTVFVSDAAGNWAHEAVDVVVEDEASGGCAYTASRQSGRTAGLVGASVIAAILVAGACRRARR